MATVANDSVTPKERAHLKGTGLVLLAGVFWSTAGIIVQEMSWFLAIRPMRFSA